jgi:hypothetical protein
MNRLRVLGAVLMVLFIFSNLLFVPLVMGQAESTPEATDYVDGLPEANQVIVIQADELAGDEDGVIVVPVPAEEDSPIDLRELVYLVGSVAGWIAVFYLIFVNKGQAINTLDRAYESVSPTVGAWIKDGIMAGLEAGRKAVAATPGDFDDEAFNRLANELVERVVNKLQHDGLAPYPHESEEGFQARRATAVSAAARVVREG